MGICITLYMHLVTLVIQLMESVFIPILGIRVMEHVRLLTLPSIQLAIGERSRKA